METISTRKEVLMQALTYTWTKIAGVFSNKRYVDSAE
jgi:hypothetical protein